MRFVGRRAAVGFAAILVAGFVATGIVAMGEHARAASASVATASGSNRFTPNAVTVNVGDQVTFTYGGTGFHNATSATGAWTAIALTSSSASGSTGAFSAPGTYYYYCSIHTDAASANEAHVAANDAMVGKIVVQAAATATATTPAGTATTPAATATTPAATATTPAATPTATVPPPSNAPCKLTVVDFTVGANTRELTIPFAQQARAGYVAIHEASAAGGPGPVIGASGFLAGGSQNANLKISLDRALKDGERVWAMLHTEDTGNTTYDGAAVDRPTVDASCGNPATGNIVTFPMKVSFTPAPPSVGTGLREEDGSATVWFAIAGAVVALTVAGGLLLARTTARIER